jgi:hypothetical protein
MAFGRDEGGETPATEVKVYGPGEELPPEIVGAEQPKKPRRKISWLTALVAGLVAVFVVSVLLLAVLFTNYRRGAKLSKIMKGAENVYVEVYTTRDNMESNKVDVIQSEKTIEKVLREMGVNNPHVKVDMYQQDRPEEPQEEQGGG